MKNLYHFIKFVVILFLIFIVISCEKENIQDPDTFYSKTDDSLVIRKTIYSQNTPEEIMYYTDFQYNSKGLLIKTSFYGKNNTNLEFRSFVYDSMEYDVSNRLIRKTNWQFYTEEDVWNISDIEIHTFLNDSIEVITTNVPTTGYSNRKEITRKGELLVKEEYYYDNHLYQAIKYLYNSDNKLNTVNYFNNSNELYLTQKYSYLTNQVIIVDKDNENKITKYTFQKYKYNKLVSSKISDLIFGNTRQVLYFEYDKFGRITKEYRNPIQLPYMSMIALPTIIVYQYD